MNRILSIAVLATTTLFLLSCQKDNDDKPVPGATTAVYSNWFQATPWKKDTIFGIWGFNYDKVAPDITQQVMDSCVILTFGKMSGYNPAIWPTNQIGQLPIMFVYKQGNTVTDTWSASPSVGKLRIRFVNDANIYNVISDSHLFRYIIIKGGLPAGRGTAMSYEDICKYYNIPE